MWQRRSFIGACGAGLAGPALAQFRVEIAGVGATQMPIAIARFRDEDARRPRAVGDRARRSRAQRLFKGVDTSSVVDERSHAGDGRMARAHCRRARGRLGHAARRRALRRSLQAVGRDQGRSSSAAQSSAVAAGDLRLAAHRIADYVYEKLTGEKGVFSTRIAYVTKAGNRYTLRVADADGEDAQIALNSPEPIISPAWSPDGRELAYVSFENQKAAVWVQDVYSGKRNLVANFRGSNSAPAWSPDGKQLAATLTRDAGSQLYLMGRDGENVRRMTTSAAIDTEPVFAPDGRTIYFVSDRGGGPQIYRMPVGGGAVQRITFDGSYNISPSDQPRRAHTRVCLEAGQCV